MADANAMADDPAAALEDILADLGATPDRAIGGSAAAARANASHVAKYLKQLRAERRSLPRHGGRPSHGKIAQEIAASGSPPVRFNRQNFDTNPWCARMLAAFDEWERGHGLTALAQAQQAAEAKEPAEKRLADLERENLLLRAEVQHVRSELALLRGIVAETGRLP